VYLATTNYQSAERSTDVELYRSTDGGQSWSGPVDVSDESPDARQFLLWLDVDPHGKVIVGYDDRLLGSGADVQIHHRLSFSTDGGQSWKNVGAGITGVPEGT